MTYNGDRQEICVAASSYDPPPFDAAPTSPIKERTTHHRDSAAVTLHEDKFGLVPVSFCFLQAVRHRKKGGMPPMIAPQGQVSVVLSRKVTSVSITLLNLASLSSSIHTLSIATVDKEGSMNRSSVMIFLSNTFHLALDKIFTKGQQVLGKVKSP